MKSRKEEEENLKNVAVDAMNEKMEPKKNEDVPKKYSNALIRFGIIASICSLCIAGVCRPSVFNAIYFICFLAASTCLGFNQKLRK